MDFGLEASLDHTDDQAGIVNGARYPDMIIQFFVPKLIWSICCFNKIMPHGHTARETMHETLVYPLVSVIRIGPPDRVI